MFGYGDGGNGKGVFLNTIAGIMGDYAVATQMDTLEVAFGDRHTADLAMLCGARLVTASETEKGRAWAESRIKQLTGGDPVTARFMHKNPFTFIPTFKLTIIGNDMPKLSSVNEAMRRRFNVVPFTHKPAQPDLDLNRKLRREWPGILRWMLNGCLDWRKSRLVRPDVVLQATRSTSSIKTCSGSGLNGTASSRKATCCVEPHLPSSTSRGPRLRERLIRSRGRR